MNITTASFPLFSRKTPALMLFAAKNERPAGPPALRKLLRRVTAHEFDGAEKKLLLLHTHGQLPAERLLLVGLGDKQDITPETIRRAAGLAVKKLRDAGIARALVEIRADLPDCAAAVTEAALLATYRFTQFKTGNDNHAELQALTLCAPRAARPAVARARIIAEAVNYARAIGNLPGNVVTPAVLADYARQLARQYRLQCAVLDKPALRRGRFGGLLAVGGGSANEPRLIVLEYVGPGAARQQPVALVGKALTFDSGGISIKPSEKMDEMKFDKCGGVAVLGTLRAAAELKLPVRLLGVIAAAENLPSATSYRPGDIVTSYRGKDKRGVTIEVLNTDAEGRIVLGDALAYARQRGAATIVDLATLTGACVIALGPFAAGLLGNNEKLLEKIRAAGERTGDRVWPLPLWPEYKELIKSDVADHKNTGGRNGGAITAAAFLANYVGAVPWAHIDIAGTAWTTEERPYHAKGATGFGVRLLIDFLSRS
jgi:leucyl aminopeptidase